MRYYIQRPANSYGSVNVHVLSDKRTTETIDTWDGPEVADVAATGNVRVSSPREEPNFGVTGQQHAWIRPHGGNPDGSDDVLTSIGGVYKPTKDWSNPTELFTHHSPVVKEAFVDPSLRHALPTMVGMAMNAMGAGGDTPVAANDLSKWSSTLSRKAAKRGLAKGHPENVNMSVTNSIDMYPRHERMYHTNDAGERIPTFQVDGAKEATPEEVSAARSWVKSRVKGKRGEQFKGIEDGLSVSQREWQAQRINPGPGQESLF